MPDQPEFTSPPDAEASAELGESADPSELSRFLLALIELRMKESLESVQRHPGYYVLRSQQTKLMSVLAGSTLSQEQHVIYGPKSFADCVAFINQAMAAELARNSACDTEENP